MLLEINYRERLHMVTNEVKRRLDYQIALQELHRQMEKEHMVNWVEKSVIGSISPQQVRTARSRCRVSVLVPPSPVCLWCDTPVCFLSFRRRRASSSASRI